MTVEPNKGPVVGMRHVQTLLIFLNITGMYLGRLNVGVSVVAMTNAESTNPNFPEYDWSESHKALILSSFFWGYIVTQFVGGYLCKRFGVKSVMLWGAFASGVTSALTPLFIGFGGWQAYCGIRVLMGFAQGLLFPCIHQHLARWSPPAERNRLGALSHTGIECGNVCAMFLSGMIAKSAIGWPGISYVSAGVAFGWCALWFIFASNNATESRFIGEAELHYIESSLKHSDNYHKKVIPIPWRAICSSLPVLALLITRCCETYGLSTLQAEIPSYMNGVLDMDIKSNAFFSALPFLAMWFMSYVYLITADILLGGNRLSLTALRKTFNSLAFWIPCATLIGIGFLDKDQKTLAIVLMTLSVGFNSGATIGSSLNTIDLSPNHASILMGIVNTAANVVPIITPLVVGFIVKDTSDRTEWQIVFIIAAVLFFVGNCIFLAFGSAVCQPWDAEDFLQPRQPELAEGKPKAIDEKSR
ncbi:putative inorganic phosphate cotransporter [Drosophila obscura]|uniref:putative inorganic phosphate cotransporter n=1 Tax=Drosophila obscura TaxID=7282 RepID=UPI001BB26A2A|nr:putative inorganic phosphate cotransporter [Drosophila obscura]